MRRRGECRQSVDAHLRERDRNRRGTFAASLQATIEQPLHRALGTQGRDYPDGRKSGKVVKMPKRAA